MFKVNLPLCYDILCLELHFFATAGVETVSTFPAVLAFCHDPIMGVLGVAALLVWAPQSSGLPLNLEITNVVVTMRNGLLWLQK